jgi:hypothetical protein
VASEANEVEANDFNDIEANDLANDEAKDDNEAATFLLWLSRGQ